MSKPAPDPVFCLRGSGAPVACLKYQTEDVLYSGHTDGTVHAWSMKTKRIQTSIPAHPGHSVLWVEFVGDHCMLTQGRDGEIKVWSLSSDSVWFQTSKLQSSSMGFCKGCLLDERSVAVQGEDQSDVKVYDLVSGQTVANMRADKDERKYGMCMSIKSAGEGLEDNCILTGYEDGSVASWDMRKCKMVDSLKVHDESLMCMDYSKTLKKGFSGSANEILKSWTFNDNVLNVKDTATIVNPGFNDVIIREDNKIIVTAGWDFKIRVFGAKHLRPLAILNYHKNSVSCLTFSSSKMLACGSKDSQISLWDIYR